jgi:hypothetical protein
MSGLRLKGMLRDGGPGACESRGSRPTLSVSSSQRHCSLPRSLVPCSIAPPVTAVQSPDAGFEEGLANTLILLEEREGPRTLDARHYEDRGRAREPRESKACRHRFRLKRPLSPFDRPPTRSAASRRCPPPRALRGRICTDRLRRKRQARPELVASSPFFGVFVLRSYWYVIIPLHSFRYSLPDDTQHSCVNRCGHLGGLWSNDQRRRGGVMTLS